MMGTIKIKRIYDEPSEDDGYRVLVDRIWPRGVSKAAAHLDAWNKDVTPSTELRKWFDHRSERFEEFAIRYQDELKEQTDALDDLRSIAKTEGLTLLYAAKSPTVNHAAVLRNVLLNRVQ